MSSVHERKGHVWGRCGGLKGEVLSLCLEPGVPSSAAELGAWLEGGV